MFFKNKELAIIFSILMVVSAFLLLPAPMANAVFKSSGFLTDVHYKH